MLIPLHVRSHYSVGEAAASVDDLVARAALLGLPALALTDIDNLSAQPRFHDLCQRFGVRAITGVELRSERRSRRGRVVLLARDAAGYRSLVRIVSRRRGGAGTVAEQRALADPVVAAAWHPHGLYVLTDDADVLARLLERDDIDRASLRALLAPPGAAGRDALRALATERHVPLVAAAETVLADPGDAPVARLLAAIERNERTSESALERPAEGGWLLAPHEAETLFADAPLAVEETHRIAAECRFQLRRDAPIVPRAESFGGTPPDDELARRCTAALAAARRDGRAAGAEYDGRLARELDVIRELGYAGYLLAAAEVAAAARERAIPAAPRGSAVGSLAVHLLGISRLDPLRFELVFERFLHPGRAKPPDVDLDVCSVRRDELIRRVYERFGPARVAMVGAHQGFGTLSALTAGLEAVGVPAEQVRELAAALARRGAGDDTALDLPPGLPYPCAPRTLRTIARLVGKPRTLALHPSGVVIAPDDIDGYVPVERASRWLTVAQYDADAIERTGLAKLDLLGNRFLSQLAATLERTAAPDLGESACAAIPLEDGATLARIDRADTIGCFQLETPPVRALLAQLPVGRIEDVVAALALVRPGASGGAVRREYVRRARGEAPARPLHPLAGGTLAETMGLVVYDEDLMRLLRDAGGLTLAEADRMRAELIDAEPEELKRLEAELLARARALGRNAADAQWAWRTTARFAAYSFSKAHALCHALLAYESAYLKEHHPVEFACAVLDGYAGAYPLRTIAADIVRGGTSILPPCVNRSSAATEVEADGAADAERTIRVGLARVKYLSERSVLGLAAEREQGGRFESVGELLRRVRLAPRELRALVLAGACDDLAPFSKDVYPFAHDAFLAALPALDAAEARAAEAASAVRTEGGADRYRLLVRVRNELEYLGMHLAAHPLAVLREEADRLGCVGTAEARERAAHGPAYARIAAVVAASRRHRTIAGRPPTFYLTLEDEEGLLEAVIPRWRYAKLAPRVTTPGPYLVEGTAVGDHGRQYLIVSALRPFRRRPRAARPSSELRSAG